MTASLISFLQITSAVQAKEASIELDKKLLLNSQFGNNAVRKKQTLFTVSYDRRQSLVIAPDGSKALSSNVILDVGYVWPYSGPVYDTLSNQEVGSLNQVCTLMSLDSWFCEGVFSEIYNVRGIISFEGTYDNRNLFGTYPVDGGTDFFVEAVGKVTDRSD